MGRFSSLGSENVQKSVDSYIEKFDEGKLVGDKEKTEEFVSDYYDIATDFYEYGWGDCFHFAPVTKNETYKEAIKRHEYFLALRLGLKPGMTVLDTGCGVGGPAMNIATFSECNVVGLNINKYQIKKATEFAQLRNLSDKVSFLEGSFLEIPKPENTYDGIYSIEATCHAADQAKCYGEIFRVMKPGAYFACYEWLLTDKYDPNNAEHVEAKRLVELGDALPEIRTVAQTKDVLEKIGYKICEWEDRGRITPHNSVPWYSPLDNGFISRTSFRTSRVGLATTHAMVSVLETLRMAPKGTKKCHTTLRYAITGLVQAGKLDIFTPAFFFLVQKPPVGEASGDAN
jgi:sterol 24-C-methyltransferase